MASKLSSFLAELRRRKVYRVATAYVIVGVGILGAAEVILDPLGLETLRPFLVILVLLGFPIALVLAWAYEIKPEEARKVETRGAVLAEASTGGDRKSIVVLPFDNMSPEPGDAYFADGLTEEIITTLSHVRSLRVISRSSAMVLKGTQKDVRTIGRELDVQYVLEGSVRKAGNDLRITAQLIDAISDEHLWAEKYDGVWGNVFEMQEQVSLSIVDALRLSLAPEEKQRLTERPIEDVRAYELYLMARREMWAGTADSLVRARRHLEHGLEILGENVVLLEGLAETHLTAYEAGVGATEARLSDARALVDRIRVLNPDSAYGHYFMGRMERFRGSCAKATEHWRRALAVEANHSASLSFLFHTYALQIGKPEYATPLIDQIVQQDPLNPLTWVSVFWYHMVNSELEEAEASLRKVSSIVGPSEWWEMFDSYRLLWQDRREEALLGIKELIARDTPNLFTEWASLLRAALRGERFEVRTVFSEENWRFGWEDAEAVWLIASAAAFGGQADEALDWLEHAVDRGWINYPLFSQSDPLLENVRKEGRFQVLMDRVKREWEAFEVRQGG